MSLYLWFEKLWGLLGPLRLAVYCYTNNRMMAYVEDKLYGDPKPQTDG